MLFKVTKSWISGDWCMTVAVRQSENCLNVPGINFPSFLAELVQKWSKFLKDKLLSFVPTAINMKSVPYFEIYPPENLSCVGGSPSCCLQSPYSATGLEFPSWIVPLGNCVPCLSIHCCQIPNEMLHFAWLRGKSSHKVQWADCSPPEKVWNRLFCLLWNLVKNSHTSRRRTWPLAREQHCRGGNCFLMKRVALKKSYRP